MARGPLTFRQTDMTRAIRAAQAAGCEVSRVIVDKAGRIVVILGSPSASANDNAAASAANEWDDAVL